MRTGLERETIIERALMPSYVIVRRERRAADAMAGWTTAGRLVIDPARRYR